MPEIRRICAMPLTTVMRSVPESRKPVMCHGLTAKKLGNLERRPAELLELLDRLAHHRTGLILEVECPHAEASEICAFNRAH